METINVVQNFANVAGDIKTLIRGFSIDVVNALAAKYQFDATEAIRFLNLEDVSGINVVEKKVRARRGRKTNAEKATRAQDIIADMISCTETEDSADERESVVSEDEEREQSKAQREAKTKREAEKLAKAEEKAKKEAEKAAKEAAKAEEKAKKEAEMLAKEAA